MPLDYPSRGDAELALARGQISRLDYERIVGAHDRGVLPPQDSALGGHLGFHGEGERWAGFSGEHDWTEGCIGMSDADIEFLSERVGPGVPVLITP